MRNSAAKKKAEKRTDSAESPYSSGNNIPDINYTIAGLYYVNVSNGTN